MTSTVIHTDDHVRRALCEHIDRHFGSQKRWAKYYGYSPSYVGDVVNGRKPISPAIAAIVGFEPVGGGEA